MINCKFCNETNQNYTHTCSKCNSILRDKIPNVDLWETLGKIVESPSAAFKNILLAEHKNYFSFFLFFFIVKLIINVYLISPYTPKANVADISFSGEIFIFAITFLFLIILLSFLYKIIISKYSADQIRIKDTIAFLSWSALPLVFGAAFLFLIEIILFGEYLFRLSPGIFDLKPELAYVSLFIEIALALWQFILLTIGLNRQHQNRIISIIASLIVNIIIYTFIYQFSIYLL